MWLNEQQSSIAAIRSYRKALEQSQPRHLVIDGLFNQNLLDSICEQLQQQHYWQTQKHSYDALYVSDEIWQNTAEQKRFVKRDQWQHSACHPTHSKEALALDFLCFLRSSEFMSLLSRIFRVELTDLHVENPKLNTNFFRMAPSDFVHVHADDSPGREVCLLLYLNKNWHAHYGGELVFNGEQGQNITIAPLYNRCVLFDPASAGAEHWVNAVQTQSAASFRYNVTSWYWSK